MQYKPLDSTLAFKALSSTAPLDIKTSLDAKRIQNSTIPAGGGLQFNWAAMPVGDTHLKLLSDLALEQELAAKYRHVVSGVIMNPGEQRMVLHHLTRGRVVQTIKVEGDGEEKGSFYQEQLENIRLFSENVRSRKLTGSTGKAFKTIVQIGIGGSDLGPRAMCLALEGWCKNSHGDILETRFISNVDPDDAADVLSDMDFETTLFILVSKSGTTQETLTNRDLVMQAMQKSGIQGLDGKRHMVAVTSKTSPLANSKEVLTSFFIDDHIGGRYSSTSAVGCAIMSLAFGFDTVREFLEGAHEADVLALEEHPLHNAAMFDALLGVYMRNVLHLGCTAVLPYSQALSRFPAHLQQLDMESNGKHVDRNGIPVAYPTGPVVFGEPGTNGQHSFYQLLHQGTDTIPLQFIGFSDCQRGFDITTENSTSQQKLIANLVAQITAFARGKTDGDPNKEFEGNRYSSVLHGKHLSPRALGALLAHFENKVMFQGFLWNLNSFDQEGVQLGKVLAKQVLAGSPGDEVLQAYSTLFL